MLTRRQFICTSGLAAAGTLLYTRCIEPGWLDLTHHQVPFFPDPGPGLRVMHLSDLHYSDVVPISLIEKAFRLGLKQKPDLVCLTGDYLTGHLPEREHYLHALKSLTRVLPVYACLGNHDYLNNHFPGALVMPPLLKEAGVHLLENRAETVECQGRHLQIVGMGDLWAGACQPQAAFAVHQPALPTLLLSHNPDSKVPLQSYPWKLMLCGHSHGGQIKIPFYGAITAPILDFNYIEGLNSFRDRWIYTTRGVGNLSGIRFNCPPEVTILDLV